MKLIFLPHHAILAISIFAACTLSACSAPNNVAPNVQTEGFATLTGIVVYTGTAKIKPNSIATIAIEDASIADVSAIVLATQKIENPTGFPIAFTLKYDPKKINLQNHFYGLRVRIENNGHLEFINDTRIGIITGDYPTHDIHAPVVSTIQ